MKNFLQAASLLAADLASTIVFLVMVLIIDRIPALAPHAAQIGIASGILFGLGQIGIEFVRRKPIGVIQWLSLVLVIGFGGASLITNNPVFVMFKPSIIYVIVGSVMLKRGWMNRYLPPEAQELVPDLGTAFGYIWAGLMFFSAALNIAAISIHLNLIAWATFLSIYGTGSKLGLFVIQYATMRFIGVRRYRRREREAAAAAASPLAAAA